MKPVFYCAVFLILFSPIGIDVYLPALPAMQQEFGSSEAQIQLSLSLFVFSLGLAQLLVGPLTDRFGRRPVAIAGITLYGITSMMIVFVDYIDTLLMLRVFQGFGASCCSVVAMTVVRDSYTPVQGARIYSYINGLLCLAPALAPVLGGVLVEAFGWRSSFVFLAAFAAAVLGLILLRMPETRPTGTRLRFPELRHNYRRLLSNRPFLVYAPACMLSLAVVLNFAIVSPAILMGRLGVSTLQFALLFGFNALVIMAASFLAPRVIALCGRQLCVVIGSVAMALAGILLWFWNTGFGYSIAAFVIPVAIASTGFSLVLGAAASLALEPFADCAGTASSLQGSIQFLGASLCSMLLASLPLAAILGLAMLMKLAGLYGAVSWFASRRSVRSENS